MNLKEEHKQDTAAASAAAAAAAANGSIERKLVAFFGISGIKRVLLSLNNGNISYEDVDMQGVAQFDSDDDSDIPPEDVGVERRTLESLWENTSGTVFIQDGSKSITYGSFSRFEPGRWLNDELMNFLCGVVLQAEYPNVLILNSYFMSALIKHDVPLPPGEEYYDFGRVRRWIREQKLPGTKRSIFDFEKILVPINAGSVHWIFIFVDMQSKLLRLYDGPFLIEGRLILNSDDAESNVYLWYMRKFLYDASLLDNGADKTGSIHSWTLLNCSQDVPLQRDGSSCGLFVMFGMILVSEGLLLESGSFTQQMIDTQRFKVAYGLFKGWISRMDWLSFHADMHYHSYIKTLPRDFDESQASDGTSTTSATSGGPALNSHEELAEDDVAKEVTDGDTPTTARAESIPTTSISSGVAAEVVTPMDTPNAFAKDAHRSNWRSSTATTSNLTGSPVSNTSGSCSIRSAECGAAVVTPTAACAVSTSTTSATSGGPALNSHEELAEDDVAKEVTDGDTLTTARAESIPTTSISSGVAAEVVTPMDKPNAFAKDAHRSNSRSSTATTSNSRSGPAFNTRSSNLKKEGGKGGTDFNNPAIDPLSDTIEGFDKGSRNILAYAVNKMTTNTEELICGSCKDLLGTPMRVSCCKGVYCFDCLPCIGSCCPGCQKDYGEAWYCRKIGDKIDHMNVHCPGNCGWFGPMKDHELHWSLHCYQADVKRIAANKVRQFIRAEVDRKIQQINEQGEHLRLNEPLDIKRTVATNVFRGQCKAIERKIALEMDDLATTAEIIDEDIRNEQEQARLQQSTAANRAIQQDAKNLEELSNSISTKTFGGGVHQSKFEASYIVSNAIDLFFWNSPFETLLLELTISQHSITESKFQLLAFCVFKCLG